MERKMLILADLHLGKIRHFRSRGVAVTPRAGMDNFQTLQLLIHQWNPGCVIFLGDLFHSRYNQDWDLLLQLLKEYGRETRYVLVKGNHDILPEKRYDPALLQTVESPYPVSPFILTHYPADPGQVDPSSPQISGHLHPGVKLRGMARQYEKLPCFYLRQQKQLVLPAFGSFTGLYPIKPAASDRVFAIFGDQVREFFP